MLLSETRKTGTSHRAIRPGEIAILAIDALLILFIAAFMFSTIAKLKAGAIEKQLKIQATIADILSDEINHSFQAMNLVLIGLSDYIRSKGVEDRAALAATISTEPANEMLRGRMSGLSFLDALTVTDDIGQVLATSRVWPAPDVSFGDRQYFKVMKSMRGPPFYLSRPIIGRIAGQPNLVLSHRLLSSSGRFLGVVNAASDQTYFANRLSRIDLGADSLVAFILNDGAVMAQAPVLTFDKSTEATPPSYDPKALFALPLAGGLAPAGVLDDRERYTAVRRLPSFPASIVVSVSARTVDGEIRRMVIPIAVACLVISLVIVLVTGLWIRQLRRDRRQADLQYIQARTDMMTGLANRLCFTEWLEKLDGGGAQPLALYFVDLDYFKTINDTLGHDVGDQLLMAVAERLEEAVSPRDGIARLGGDEFAIVRPGVASEADAFHFAETIVAALGTPFPIEGQQLAITTSIGISLYPRHGQDAVTLLKNADLALFKAKTDGRGQARVFCEELARHAESRRRLQLDLEEAWANDQFHLVYQPIFEAGSRRLSGFEALLRWTHPERGVVPPDVFIPLAEETGLIVRLGGWVLERATAAAMSWPAQLFVSVNLSPIQFRGGAVEAQVDDALALSGLASHRLELEITESTLLQREGEVQSILAGFRKAGIKIALDDFGTGYSSLRYLVDFQIDRLKVDRCFVEGLADKPQSKAIVQAVLALAATLGLDCTAEGVETEEQATILQSGGCSHLQGYLLGRPLRPEDARSLASQAREPQQSPAV